METPKGPCILCGMNTSRLCSTCGDAFVCSNLCNKSTTVEHMKTCGTHEKTTADDLFNCITGDIPIVYETLKDFGWDKCDTFTDISYLHRVYKLLMVDCCIAPPLLNKWREEGKMWMMIKETFEGHKEIVPGNCYDFVLVNRKLF